MIDGARCSGGRFISSASSSNDWVNGWFWKRSVDRRVRPQKTGKVYGSSTLPGFLLVGKEGGKDWQEVGSEHDVVMGGAGQDGEL